MLPIERAGYFAHSQTSRFRNLEAATREQLAEWLERYSPTVSWSGGKDSGVCAHMANSIKPTPLVLLNSGGEHPLSPQHCRETAERFGWEFSVHLPRLTYVELLELAYEMGENSTYLPPGAVREFIIHETSEAASEHYSANAYILGLRKEESRDRATTIRIHGTEHLMAKNGLTRLLPLARWQTEDVLAYHAKYDLPLHPAYTHERLQGERLDQIRVGVIVDPCAEHTGPTWAKLRMYHPQVFHELRRRLPSVPWPI